eukprot:11082964-Ditylum_brightwellii.AAC.1
MERVKSVCRVRSQYPENIKASLHEQNGRVHSHLLCECVWERVRYQLSDPTKVGVSPLRIPAIPAARCPPFARVTLNAPTAYWT